MKFLGVAVGLALLAGPVGAPVMGTNSDMAVSSVTSDINSADSESFSVIGDMDLSIGDEVTFDELEAVGVSSTEAKGLLDDASPHIARIPAATGFVSPQAATATAKVGWYWKDNRNRTINLRTDANHKLVTKHNVTMKVARTTTKYPQTTKNPSSTRWEYRTPVNDVRCSGWGIFRKCKIVGKTTVLAVVDFRILSHDKKSKGIVTTYCPGVTKCPDYVKNAANT